MNLTEMEDRAARARRGKLELKVRVVLIVLLMIAGVVVVGRLVA